MFGGNVTMHTLEKEDVCRKMNVDPAAGLSEAEAADRLKKYGPNKLQEGKKKTIVQMFLEQLKDPMIYILGAAVLISCFLREFSDAVIMMGVILINAIIGTVQENKAEQSLDALKEMSSPSAMVRRGGVTREIPSAELVPGDIVVLEAGRVIPADLRLLDSVNLKIEESSLTGESVPVEKDAGFKGEGEIPLGDRINMAYQSTFVTYGRGEGVVVATGMETEIGNIAKLINDTEQELTPLQKRLGDLSKLLGIICVALCVMFLVVGILQKRDLAEMLITAISLAVAAIPEGLTAIVTIVLALGVQRMVKANTIVRKLPSVETLGSVSVVCSDKTGTLTQNRMTVTRLWQDGEMQSAEEADYDKFRTLIDGMSLCSDASVDGEIRLGDPTELALVDLSILKGVPKALLDQKYPRVFEMPFDSDRKMMTTVHQREDGSTISYTKGATDVILQHCVSVVKGGGTEPLTEADKAGIMLASKAMADEALRVLALAVRPGNNKAVENELIFVGLVGMIDPPRPEAKEAVARFKEAHVRTVMITGDHKDTAFAIARELGIADDPSQCISGTEIDALTQDQLNEKVDSLRVFARVSPENKVQIVKALKSHGYIVSMTGDGVNDAPSLNAADIGVAMGITGTDVAKSAADMVLTDDNFASIEKAIFEGRIIYNNIRKTVLFMLSSNFGEIITMCGSIFAGLLSPLKAIHILWINLITDSLPALALGVDGGTKSIMKEPPRDPHEGLFAHGGFALTLGYGALIACATLAAYLIIPIETILAAGGQLSVKAIDDALTGDVYMRSQTYAFTVLGISELFHAIGMRDTKTSIFRMNHLNNKTMIIAFFAGLALQVLVTEVPFFVNAFQTSSLSLMEWLRLLLLSSAPLWMHEIIVLFRRNK